MRFMIVLFYIALQILANARRQEKGIRCQNEGVKNAFIGDIVVYIENPREFKAVC